MYEFTSSSTEELRAGKAIFETQQTNSTNFFFAYLLRSRPEKRLNPTEFLSGPITVLDVDVTTLNHNANFPSLKLP